MLGHDPSKKYKKTDLEKQIGYRTSGAFSQDLTFSGCDIVPVVYGSVGRQKPRLYVIGDIATLTYSVHQDKGAVRTLGRSAPRGFVRGPETIAGTMIFNIFNRQALWELTSGNRHPSSKHTQSLTHLPSFDVVLYFANEAGREATLGIFGIQFMDEGQSHSVEDTYVEKTAQYVAQRIEPLTPISSPMLVGKGQKAEFVSDHRDQQLRKHQPFDYTYLNVTPPAT